MGNLYFCQLLKKQKINISQDITVFFVSKTILSKNIQSCGKTSTVEHSCVLCNKKQVAKDMFIQFDSVIPPLGICIIRP